MKLVLAAFFIFVFLVLTRALTGPNNNPSTENTQQGIVVSMSPGQSSDSLQLHRLPIVTVTPTPTASPVSTASGDCAVPAASTTNLSVLVNTIAQKFGVKLGGNALTIDKAILTYESMCLAFRSPTFQKNLNSLQNPVTVNFVNAGKCFAWTYASPPHTDLQEPCPTLVDKYILIHELVHQMQYGGAQGRNAFMPQWQAQVWSQERNHRIPTGPCVIEDPGDGGECEADAVAEYIYYKEYRNSWSGNPAGGPNLANYATDWPLWYNFVKTNFFGGVTY
ncbi:MAG TPA: hypothetical protein VLG12_07815 [Candidatus Saccharimonadales bacterium]|nr:hypothetical protein [Candidatus Saccharimonadales bacterium]